MLRWFGSLLVCVMMWCCSSASPPGSGPDSGLRRLRRSSHCADGVEYSHGDLCCKNCPAGSRMKSPCTRPGTRGECEECDVGTFTDFGNSLKKCLSCSLCRSDQEVVRPCGSTHNTECQCRPGGFCAPDQACEVCKRCARCGKDEIVVRNCTATSNTECKKKPADSGRAADWTALSVTLGLTVPLAVIVSLLFFVCVRRRRRKEADSGRSPGDTSGYSGTEKSSGASSPRCWTLVRPRSLPLDVEEQRGLCETPGSASNSQANLISTAASSSDPRGNLTLLQPLCARPAPLQASCVPALTLPSTRIDEPHFNVAPVNGEASLRSCFEFFEELLDVNYQSRFFRNLGLTDNQIKSKVSLSYDDRVHDLLNLWLEKRGRKASLGDLLKALMDLNQRRTAEMVVERAVEAGHYVYE